MAVTLQEFSANMQRLFNLPCAQASPPRSERAVSADIVQSNAILFLASRFVISKPVKLQVGHCCQEDHALSLSCSVFVLLWAYVVSRAHGVQQ